MTPSNLLQVLSGTATPPTLALQSGVELAPQSLGRAGMWFVDGEGVLDVHGYVYWDGVELYVQSHDPQNPIFADGAPVPLDWTPVAAPTVLFLGGVQISFSRVGPVLSDAPTQMGHSSSPVNQERFRSPFAGASGEMGGPAPVMLGAPTQLAPVGGKGGKASAKGLKDPRQLGMLGVIVVMLCGAGWMVFAPARPPAPAGSTKTAQIIAPATAVPTVVAPPAPREALPLVPATPLAKGVVVPATELRIAIEAQQAGREAEAQRLFDALASKYPGHPELQSAAQILRSLRPAK